MDKMFDYLMVRPYYNREQLDVLNEAHKFECAAYHKYSDAWINEYDRDRSRKLRKKAVRHRIIANALADVIDNCVIY